MKVSISSRGVEGLATRLAARIFPPVVEKVAAQASDALAREIATATGAAPQQAGTPLRPLVRVTDPAVLDRVRGDAAHAGDPVLDRVRLAFTRRPARPAPTLEGTTP